MNIFQSITLLFTLFALGSIIIWSIRTGISPMPTVPMAKHMLLMALPEHVEGTVYELGSGWGTLAFPLAKKYPSNRVTAYEISLIPYLVSEILLKFSSSHNLTFIRADFFKMSLSDAGLIVCYLYPASMQTLKSQFEASLKPGTFVVSNTFSIPGWTPLKTFEIGDIYHSKIYLYRFDKI